MEKAVLYARVSSDLQQKERSIESQIAELKKQVIKSGKTLVKEYTDDGYSGALLDRPAMNELRNDLKTNKFETIYILNADRIARDVTYQNIIVGEILHYKKQLIINGKDYIHNPENKFTLTVLGAVSELERAKLIERVTRGRMYRLKQGYLMGNGWQTYGYRYIKKSSTSYPSYELIPEEAKILRYIFNTYSQGNVGIRTIVSKLKEMNVPRIKGRNMFGQSQIKHILKNEMYTGTRYFNTMKMVKVGDPMKKQIKRKEFTDRSEWIGIKVPVIISKDLYEKAKLRLAYNYKCWRNSKRTQLLSQIIWCGKCDSRCFSYRRSYHHTDRKIPTINRRAVYKCNNKSAGIHNPEINNQVLESCVWEMINNTLSDPHKLFDRIGFLKKRQSSPAKIEVRMKNIEAKILNLHTQKKRILDLYAAGTLDHEEYLKRTSKYNQEIEGLKAIKNKFQYYIPLSQNSNLIRSDIETYCSKVKEQLSLCENFDTKRKFLLEHMSKVTFYRKNKTDLKIKIYGTIPITTQTSTPTSVEFKIERNFGWHEIQAHVPKTSPEDDIICRAPLLTT